jgi:hypothetical protein
MRLWCRCFGPVRSLDLVLGVGRLGGQFAGGVAGQRLLGWVGSEGEASYRAERGERGRGEQDVVEPAGGAGAAGVGGRPQQGRRTGGRWDPALPGPQGPGQSGSIC